MILVTGGTGMTGQFVVQELQRRGYTVRVLARPASAQKVLDLGAELAEGDLADLESVRRATEGITGIIHTACTFSNSAIDIAAMQTLLQNWNEGSFVFVSSLDVYGFTETFPISEDHPLSESYGDYGRGKVICERLLAEEANATGRTAFASLRASYIWGPHPTAQQRLKLPRLRAGEPILLPGADEAEWSQYRDVWIDVRDLAWVIVECLERPPAQALNALSGHFIWHELYATLIELTASSSQIIHQPLDQISESELPHKEIYAQRWSFSNERLRKTLGFTPEFSLHQMLEAVVQTQM